MEILEKIGINFQSIVIYLVNIGILVAVISYFMTGPLLKVLDQRRKKIKDNLREAELIKEEFSSERKKLQEQNEALKTEMERSLTLLKKEIEDRRRKEDEELALKKAKMLEEIRTLVEEEKKGILKAAEREALELIVKTILSIVTTKIPEETIRQSVEDAWRQYQT